jgi:hypothetical protein
MSILGILFSGEERAMIRRAAMAAWKESTHQAPEVQLQTGNFP